MNTHLIADEQSLKSAAGRFGHPIPMHPITLPIITPPRRANRKHRAMRRLIRAAVIAAAIPAAAWLVAYGFTALVLSLKH